MASKESDLEFVTTQDMEDEYQETPQQTSEFLAVPEEEATGWTAPLRKFALFKESRHPGAAFFHLLFKALAVVFYWPLSKILGGSFVMVCVICILLLAFDFWTVKNVSGRLLVGLRWWNYVKEDGSTEWVFESTDDTSSISATDRRLFWVGLYAPAVIWSVFFLFAFILWEFQWLIVIMAALSLSFANIIGYTKCSKDATARIQKFTERGVAENLVNTIGVSNLISGIGGLIAKNQQQPLAPNGQTTMSV